MRQRHCNVEPCVAKHYAGGWCKKHYTQIARHGRLTPERDRGRPKGPCAARGCERDADFRLGPGANHCRKHARQIRTHGRLTPEREHIMGNETCSVEGCQEEHRAKGYCIPHYNQQRWQRIKRILERVRDAEARSA